MSEAGERLAIGEDEMLRANKISRAQVVALPRPAAAPGPATEWIVAGIAVLLLVIGLLGL